MSNLKRLVTKYDNLSSVEPPIDQKEINDREKDYQNLPPKRFALKNNVMLFRPTTITIKDNTYSVQYNFCTNPFCKWFSLEQLTFDKKKGKPSRYRLSGSPKENNQSIICNPDPNGISVTWNCTSRTVSNWSIAEEIRRLFNNEQVKDMKTEYQFHNESCIYDESTPFSDRGQFYKRGKSKSNSQRWQCKFCKKITHVLPKQRQSFTYHQQRNEILPTFAKLVISRTPVKRSCEILKIGSQTYYNKLEWLYKKTLEFVARHETEVLQNKKFDELWVNTDKLIYDLNNIRKKGSGGFLYSTDKEDKKLTTHVVISGDVDSRYIFRSDVAYDYDITLDDIKLDTIKYKEDHLNEFSRKNARLRTGLQYYPQPPTKSDTQSIEDYERELADFRIREQYADGVHINSTYTAMAHLFLIKNTYNARTWRFVTDNDSSIISSIYRVFSKEIKGYDAHHFIYKIDRNKTRNQAYGEYMRIRKELKRWGKDNGYEDESTKKIAYHYLLEQLDHHRFYEEIVIDGKTHMKHANNYIKHPLPAIDKGETELDITTDVSIFSNEYIAKMILDANDKTISTFMQQIRRRISILERPLVTARNEGKSYIYANFNPKYAQFAITFLRVYYNFCMPYKTKDGVIKTPAQRLGLTDKVFDLKDIVYFK